MSIKYRKAEGINGFQVLTPFELAILSTIHVLISMHTQCYLERARLRLEVLLSKALYRISEGDRKTLRVKFDIAHFVATQRLATLLFVREAIHGVDVGTAYCNQNAGKSFCHLLRENSWLKN